MVDRKRSSKGAKSPKTPALKSLLKGFYYAFSPAGDDEFTVKLAKIREPKDGNPAVPETVYEITNDECSCPAGSNGVPCKHVEMVQNTFRGNTFPREEAEDAIEPFLDKWREKKAKIAVIGPLAFGEPRLVRRADVLIWLPESTETRELVVYAEGELSHLLVRAVFLPTEEAYRLKHGGARVAWSNKKTYVY